MNSSIQKKSTALVLLIALGSTACATPLAERRAQWGAPPTVSNQQFLVDEADCDKRASNKSRGLAISSSVIGGLGLLVWPLLIPGIALGIAAGTTSQGTKAACMDDRGYSKTPQDAAAPAAAPAALAPPEPPALAPAPTPAPAPSAQAPLFPEPRRVQP